MADLLGNKRGIQTQEKRQHKISNFVLRGKLCESIRFICNRETGGVFLLSIKASDSTIFANKTIEDFLEVKYLLEKKPHCYAWEEYEETPVFIPVDMTEDVVKSVPRKLQGA